MGKFNSDGSPQNIVGLYSLGFVGPNLKIKMPANKDRTRLVHITYSRLSTDIQEKVEDRSNNTRLAAQPYASCN